MIENIRLSFQGIWSHKMRSFLTMLGIIIGIASIISIDDQGHKRADQEKPDRLRHQHGADPAVSGRLPV